MKSIKLIVASSIILSLVGCGTTGNNKADNRYAVNEVSTMAAGINEMQGFSSENLLSKNKLYFDLDKYNITEEGKQLLLAHADKLLENPALKLRIEGHTDSRGSSNYNIALGERRAKAVAKVLALKGVPADRVSVVSYGKEKPAEFGENEQAWSLNRRAEIHYEEQG